MSTATTHIETEMRSAERSRSKLVPALRFKEFEGVCSERVFNELVKVIDCKHRTPPYLEVGVPLVSPGTIKWGEIDLVSPTKRVSEAEYESLMDHCSPTIGDLVFSRNQSIGVASYLKKEEKFVLGQDTVLIQSKEIDSGYNYYRLQTYSVQCLIDRLSGGSTFARINLSDLRKLKVTVAKNQREQQKIASFLSAVDEKIQRLTKKKALLGQYKKGVMQQLFSGQLRFKNENGKPYPDWEDMVLGDCLKYVQPTKYLVSSTEYDDSYETPVLTAGKTFILGYTDEKENICIDYPLIIFDDFTTASQYVDFPFKAKSSAMKLLIAKEGVDIKFMYESMQNVKFEVGGHGRHWISIFSPLVMSVPSIEEQQKIATYLSTIDTKIESVNNKITQTQSFKKGLLQQMFV
jgi:type I restriction enzyme S subunit